MDLTVFHVTDLTYKGIMCLKALVKMCSPKALLNGIVYTKGCKHMANTAFCQETLLVKNHTEFSASRITGSIAFMRE